MSFPMLGGEALPANADTAGLKCGAVLQQVLHISTKEQTFYSANRDYLLYKLLNLPMALIYTGKKRHF